MDVLSASDERLKQTLYIEDPLGADLATDPVVLTTRRALSRVATVAAETASRFEREGVEHDPVAWMMTPRRLFRGEAALDACLERPAFLRALLLHGLSLGLDTSPDAIDELVGEDDDDADLVDEAGLAEVDADLYADVLSIPPEMGPSRSACHVVDQSGAERLCAGAHVPKPSVSLCRSGSGIEAEALGQAIPDLAEPLFSLHRAHIAPALLKDLVTTARRQQLDETVA